MLKKKSLLILVSLFFIVGCSSNIDATSSSKTETTATPAVNEESIITEPEPYTKAIEFLINGDFNMAMKYLDMTIADFPDSEYAYNSHIIKSLILCAQINTQNSLGSNLGNGAENGQSLYDQKDLDRLRTVLTEHLEIVKSIDKDLTTSMMYVYDNFSDENDIKLNLSPVAVPSKTYDLDFFSRVGYPIPTNSEIESYIKWSDPSYYNIILQSCIKDNIVSYPSLFYLASNKLTSEEARKKLLTEVIEITENDKYNELRIRAQELLAK